MDCEVYIHLFRKERKKSSKIRWEEEHKIERKDLGEQQMTSKNCMFVKYKNVSAVMDPREVFCSI